jgi:hypothetical protein
MITAGQKVPTYHLCKIGELIDDVAFVHLGSLAAEFNCQPLQINGKTLVALQLFQGQI